MCSCTDRIKQFETEIELLRSLVALTKELAALNKGLSSAPLPVDAPIGLQPWQQSPLVPTVFGPGGPGGIIPQLLHNHDPSEVVHPLVVPGETTLPQGVVDKAKAAVSAKVIRFPGAYRTPPKAHADE